MAYKEFGKQIHVENSEELVAEPIFCNQHILVGNRIIFFIKTGLRKACVTLKIC